MTDGRTRGNGDGLTPAEGERPSCIPRPRHLRLPAGAYAVARVMGSPSGTCFMLTELMQ